MPRMWLEEFGGSYAAMLNFYPDLSWNSSGTPELILVADCSASMIVCLVFFLFVYFFGIFVWIMVLGTLRVLRVKRRKLRVTRKKA